MVEGGSRALQRYSLVTDYVGELRIVQTSVSLNVSNQWLVSAD